MKDKVTIDGVELTREQIEAALAKLNEPDTPKFGRWKPEKGEEYYYIALIGQVWGDIWVNSDSDFARLAFGNCHRTAEEAQNAADRQRAIVAMRDKADRVRTHPEPDREDASVQKYSAYWDCCYQSVKTQVLKYSVEPPEVPVFATVEEGRAFIEIAAWEIEYYFTGVRPDGEPLS